MPTYDWGSDWQLESEAAEQEIALTEFVGLGGDRAAILSVMHETGTLAAELRREQDILHDHFSARSRRDELAARLDRVREARIACERIPMPVPEELVAEERRVEAHLESASIWSRRTNPSVLAKHRRTAAAPSVQHVHQRIAAPRFRTVRVQMKEVHGGTPELLQALEQNPSLWPWEALDLSTLGEHLQSIRRTFIPEVIRRVFTVVRQVAPTVIRKERSQWIKKYSCPPSDDELIQVRRQASRRLYSLTARLVEAFYPYWAEDLTGSRVRTVIENQRQRVKQRSSS